MKAGRVCLLGGLLALSGCGKFFPPLSQSGGGSSGGGTSNTGNYLYVANSNSSVDSVAGFSLSGGSLTAISGSPYASPLPPTSLAMTPNDSFLYVGSTSGAIYLYTVGSSGALTLGDSGTPVFSGDSPAAMEVDPNGNWLVWVSAFSGEAYALQINSSTGILTDSAGVGLASTSASGLAITPNDEYVYVALGTGGVETLSFNSSTGALTPVNTVLAPKQNLDADLAVAVSPNGQYLFVTETGINAVRMFSIAANGTLSEVTGSPFATGLGPAAVLVDSTGSYVYVANRTSNTISGFTIGTGGALTAISGSPFATGTTPVALVEDKSKGYVAVANEGGSADLQVFAISTATPGALVSSATSTTGTDPTQAMAIAATQ